VKSLDCNDESLTEESVSTGKYTEELTSAVTNTHIEESTSTGTRTFTKEPTSTLRGARTEESTSAVSRTPTEESTSTVRGILTEESASTATSTHTDFSTQPQRADHSAVPQVEEIHISTREGRTHNTIILIGVLIFCLLTILLVVLLLLVYMRRRYGMYKVSSAKIKTQNNRADFSAPAEGPPAL
jgi:cobalamin biosynthesis Mg chelatase CobN